MPPRSRTRTNHRRQTPDPKQRSISEFFTASPSPRKRKPQRSPTATPCPPSNTPHISQQPPRSTAPNPISPVDRPDPVSKSDHLSVNSASTSDSNASDEDNHVLNRNFRPMHKRKSNVIAGQDTEMGKAAKTHSLMEVDTYPPEPEMHTDSDHVEPAMSQEGIELQSQLEALDCSRDEPSRSRSVSPGKRRAEVSRDVPMSKRPASQQPVEMKNKRMEDGKAPVNSNLKPSSEDSDDDSLADLYAKELAPTEPAAVVRRSLRSSKETVRFSPSKHFAGKGLGFSVFGDSFMGPRASSKNVFNKLKAMEKEKSAKAEEEKEIEHMKQELALDSDVLSQGEAEIREMACEEDKKELQRVERREKYSAPVPFFTKSLDIPKTNPNVLSHPQKGRRDHTHDVLAEALRPGWDGELALSSVAVYLEQICLDNIVVPVARVTRTAFHLLIYDDSPALTPNTHRDDLFTSLCTIVRYKKSDIKSNLLPTFLQVLEAYGVFFDKDFGSPANGAQSLSEGSLDILATDETKDRQLLMKATRNLRRACIFSAERIRQGHEFGTVLSHEIGDMKDIDAVLYGFAMCTRILISEFGCRLFREVGAVIAALLERVFVRQWRECRIKLAKQLLHQTSRLGLHAELVTRLLPCNTNRSRFLRHDIAFLSLTQWADGPGLSPLAREIQGFKPSGEAEKFGTEDVSYCVADVLVLLRRIPELQKNTDEEWGCRLAKIIMQVLCDKCILQRRNRGEIGLVHQALQKIRTCTHRMTFGVSVQEMRLALEATLAAVRDLLETSSSAQSEILPQLRSDMTQTLLSKPIA